MRRAARSLSTAARRRPLPAGPSFHDFVASSPPAPPPPYDDAAVDASPLPRALLTDRFGRFHGYLRVSLTERCNLRCAYCMPAEGVSDLTPAPQLLTAAEVARVARVFARAGASKVRLTGGEPTLRRDLAAVCASIRAAGVASVGLTTNAVNLLKPSGDGTVLDGLVRAGVDSVNVSLDSLDPATFARLTRRPPATHARVVAAVDACAAAGLRTKVNCVVMRGENDESLAAFARSFPPSVAVRFIEWMPFPGNAFDAGKLVPYAEMVERVGGLEPVAAADPHDTTKWWRTECGRTVGFITSMSDHFCGTCNRVRVTADGSLKTCLFGTDALSLRDLLRSGASDEVLAAGVHGALQKKHFKHGGHDGAAALAASTENRPMVKIGG